MSKLPHANMLVVHYLLFMSNGGSIYGLYTHLPIVGTKFEDNVSRCFIKILVYEHWLDVENMHSYINRPSIVSIVSVDIFS
jgi:hypothetical protein